MLSAKTISTFFLAILMHLGAGAKAEGNVNIIFGKTIFSIVHSLGMKQG